MDPAACSTSQIWRRARPHGEGGSRIRRHARGRSYSRGQGWGLAATPARHGDGQRRCNKQQWRRIDGSAGRVDGRLTKHHLWARWFLFIFNWLTDACMCPHLKIFINRDIEVEADDLLTSINRFLTAWENGKSSTDPIVSTSMYQSSKNTQIQCQHILTGNHIWNNRKQDADLINTWQENTESKDGYHYIHGKPLAKKTMGDDE